MQGGRFVLLRHFSGPDLGYTGKIMRPDILDLQRFYESPKGQQAHRILLPLLRRQWRNLKGLRLLGVGYATPYLGPFRAESDRTLALMPADQGARTWPQRTRNLTLMAEDESWPFEDQAFERILFIHALEFAENPDALLSECARILTPPGRLMLVLPNRLGWWARSERTPFGQGHPYSLMQIAALLERQGFTMTAWRGALYGPPADTIWLRRASLFWESFGRHLTPGLSGLLLVEAARIIPGPAAIRPARTRLRLMSNPRPAAIKARADQTLRKQ